MCETTLPTQFRQLEDTGRLENFRRAATGDTGKYTGFIFNDSDVYKWLEAVAYALVVEDKADLRKMADGVIEAIAAAQLEDGYLNTYFQLTGIENRWRNLHTMHEMYCAGHLIEAAVAFAENHQDERLLRVAIRFADHILSIFGPDGRLGFCGHEEIELAFARLSARTGDERYAERARWMIEQRGQRPSIFAQERADRDVLALSPWDNGQNHAVESYEGDYWQDHAPIREHSQVVGHAVRSMYLYTGALALFSDDEDLEAAMLRCWQSLTQRRMYITGGIGPSPKNEGFTTDFDLPNLTAYAETCAAVGLVYWGQQFLERTGNAEFADVTERALFNGAISGLSLSGDHYFYDNPLESTGSHSRKPWFDCACCPPNIARLLASVTDYLLSESESGVYIHIPSALRAETSFGDIEVVGSYPWEGKFEIRYKGTIRRTFTIGFRIPDWATETNAEIEGAEELAEFEDGYAVFDREWSPGDTIKVDFEMEPRWAECDPRVRENLGRSALCNGPLVYCAEAKDLGFAPQLVTALTEVPPVVTWNQALLGGVNAIAVDSIVEVERFPDGLYAEAGSTETREQTVSMIPYYTWNNRGPNGMQVWLRRA